jgi:hypothetical protein
MKSWECSVRGTTASAADALRITDRMKMVRINPERVASRVQELVE